MTIVSGPHLDPEFTRSRLKTTLSDAELAPRDGLTFCNYFVDRVAAWWGCLLLRDEKGNPLMASKMVERMSIRADAFKLLDPSDPYGMARDLACAGSLVIAGRSSEPHGHVAIIAPEPIMQYSGTWNKHVPQIANVGKRNFYGESLSRAFASAADPREPGLWLYLG